jgi:histidine kinase 2/3/4 (cytokinin receptor)
LIISYFLGCSWSFKYQFGANVLLYSFGEMQDTFAKYTAMTSFERPLLNGIAYAERIFPHEKEMFERKHGWIMKTMNREAAPLQDEYAPVIFSQDTVSYLARMDMMSGEV